MNTELRILNFFTKLAKNYHVRCSRGELAIVYIIMLLSYVVQVCLHQ